MQQAEAAYSRGEWARAEELARGVLNAAATHFEALNLLGIIAAQTQRTQEAAALLGRAVAANPRSAAAHNNYGNVLRRLSQPEAALASFERALQLEPDYAEAPSNRGNTLHGLRRFEEALASYDRALQLQPTSAIAHYNRGNTLHALGRFDEGLASHDRALRISPDHAEAHNSRANALQELGRPDEALASYDRALRIEPRYAIAHSNRAAALHALGRFEEALASYDRALQLAPGSAGQHNNRGNTLHALGRFEEARDSYQLALQQRPDLDWLPSSWLREKAHLCDWSDAAAQISRLAAAIEQGHKVAYPFVVLTLSDSLWLQRRAAEIWVSSNYPPTASHAVGRRTQRDRIRLGYFSADYHDHPTARLTAELFELHDRRRFEVVAFSYGPDRRDGMSRRLMAAFDHFVEVRTRSDSEIASAASEQEIDIAVDLKGFTQDARPGIFARRAAPIQVSYLGYPGTLGAPYIDYLIADRTLIPPEARAGYTERIAYLPDSYQVNDRKRPIAARQFSRTELGLPSTGFVYCCFNNNYKIAPATFDGWMRILRQVQGSVLWLLTDNETATGNLRRAAQVHEVDPARLIFAARMPLPEHLARYRAADLFLDTLPVNAHTTASDALWAGLPLLTLAGQSFAARVAASLLRATGLHELITSTQQQYETLAVELANDPGRLARLGERLRSRRASVPLFDTVAVTRHLEDAYEQMYARYLAGLSPEDIRVDRRAGKESVTQLGENQ